MWPHDGREREDAPERSFSHDCDALSISLAFSAPPPPCHALLSRLHAHLTRGKKLMCTTQYLASPLPPPLLPQPLHNRITFHCASYSCVCVLVCYNCCVCLCVCVWVGAKTTRTRLQKAMIFLFFCCCIQIGFGSEDVRNMLDKRYPVLFAYSTILYCASLLDLLYSLTLLCSFVDSFTVLYTL